MNVKIVKGKPLELPDGTLVLPEADETTGSKVLSKEEQEVNVITGKELNNVVSYSDTVNNRLSKSYKRTLADIDVEYARMNITMLVATYTLWGLDSYAISRVLNVSMDQVDALKETDLYSRIQTQITEAIKYAESTTVHGYLAEKSLTAARVVAATLKNPDGSVRLSAAKDILDRSGFRPIDRVEHNVKFDDELRIRYVTDDAAVPTIDIEAKEL